MRIDPQYGEGAPLPSKTEKRWWKIIAPIDHVPLAVTFLSETFQGFYVHYIPEINKNLPCPRSANCFMCKRGSVPRWSGYAACWSTNHKDAKIVALTEYAARQLLPWLTERKTLRGAQAILQRHPQHGGVRKKNDPVRVTFKGMTDGAKLPAAFDVLHSLERMWGCNLAFFLQAHPDFETLGNPPGDEAPGALARFA